MRLAIPVRSCFPATVRQILLLCALVTVLCPLAHPRMSVADEGVDEYNLAVGFYKKSRWDLAEESFRKFLKQSPKHVKVPFGRLYLGLTLVNQKKYGEARDVLREYVKDYPNSQNLTDALYRVAESSYFLDDLPAAEKEFKTFLDKAPKDPLAEWGYPYLADAQLRQNKAEMAAASFQKSLELFPEGRLAEDSRFGLARAYEALKQNANAIAIYKELAANRIGSRAEQSQFNLATLYFDSGDFASAAKSYADLESQFPQSSLVPLAQLNSGYALYQSGDYKQAAARFELAARSNEQATTAHYWQGLSDKALGNYAEAAAILKSAFEKQPDAPVSESILYQWGDCELRAGRLEAAGPLFLDVVKRWPKGDLADDSLHFAAEAELLRALRAKDDATKSARLAEADKLAARFAREYPESGLRFHQLLLQGRVLEARGNAENLQAALVHYRKVLDESERPETRSTARFYAARVYHVTNDNADAVKVLAPLVEQVKQEGTASEFLDALVLHALCVEAEARALLQQHFAILQEADALEVESLRLQRFGKQAEAAEKQKLADDKKAEGTRLRESAAKIVEPSVSSAKLYLELAAGGSQADQALATKAYCEAIRGDKTVANADLQILRERHPASILIPPVTHQLAELAYNDKDWPRAEQLFVALLDVAKADDDRAQGMSGLAWSQFQGKKYKEAAVNFAKFVATFPEANAASQAAFQTGKSLEEDGQLPEANAAYLKGAQSYSGTLDAYRAALGAARLSHKLKQADEADAAYQLAYAELSRHKAEQARDLGNVLYDWALLNFESKRYTRADEIFRKLLEEAPQSDSADDARYLLAEGDLIAGNLDAAKKVFRELEASSKSDSNVQQDSLYRLIGIAAEQEQWQDVLSTAGQMQSRFAEGRYRWDALFYSGEAQLHLNKPEAARDTLLVLKAEKDNPAVANKDWYPNVWVLLAESNFQLKQYDAVIATAAEFEKWDAASPFLYRAQEVLGRAYKQQAKFDEARAAFAQVVKSESGRRTETAAKSQLFLADTYFLQKDYRQALKEFLAVDVLYDFPEYQAPALFQAALCHELLGEWKQAAKTYEDLLKQFPQSEKARDGKPRLEVARKKAAEQS